MSMISKQEKLCQEVPFVFRNMTFNKNYKGIPVNQTKTLFFNNRQNNHDKEWWFNKNALKLYQNLHLTRSCENSPLLENNHTAIAVKVPVLYKIVYF